MSLIFCIFMFHHESFVGFRLRKCSEEKFSLFKSFIQWSFKPFKNTHFLQGLIVPLICHAFCSHIPEVRRAPSIVAWLFYLLFMVYLKSSPFQGKKSLLHLPKPVVSAFCFWLLHCSRGHLYCFLLLRFLNDDVLSLIAKEETYTFPILGCVWVVAVGT